ncbi:MAG TPA: SGNH/GDSL hydrolase family protein [Desulfosarcina sp.]|nr:SGNH/GDSL hydrolase family protein [Desulfosarcina sp.]
MRRCTIWAILLVLFPFPGFAGPFPEIVVFGDSLSDSGNLLFFDEQPEPDPQLYYQGRLSNGPVWVEYLAEPQRLDAALTDLALAGAQSDGLIPPGLIEQVTVYVAAVGPPLAADTLFVIWVGGNDFLNDGDGFASVVANIDQAVESLVQAGAMHLLIVNLPDLGAIPDTLGTPEADQATAFTNDFNQALGALLDQFSVDYPGVGFYLFDVFSYFETVRAEPDAFGFVNATAPSPNFAVEDNFDGAGHVFWDERHPTTRMHALIADQAFAAVNAQFTPASGTPAAVDDDDDFTCFINLLLDGGHPPRSDAETSFDER